MIDVRTDDEPISPDGRFRSIHDRHNFDRGPTITVVATDKPTYEDLCLRVPKTVRQVSISLGFLTRQDVGKRCTSFQSGLPNHARPHVILPISTPLVVRPAGSHKRWLDEAPCQSLPG